MRPGESTDYPQEVKAVMFRLKRRLDGTRPESPTATAQETGMDAPGLNEVRGTLEEALATSSADGEGIRRVENPMDDALDHIPGQSGSEGLADLPNARPEDPWDGP